MIIPVIDPHFHISIFPISHPISHENPMRNPVDPMKKITPVHQDRLEDAISSLRQLSTRAELLQPSAAAETTAARSAVGTAPEWQRRVWRADEELKELRLGG